MKILRLDLRAFGPFTDVALDLSAGNHGLHLIYGPNEAGKSSALRALRQMLYGIPVQSPDAFLHPYVGFRIGALLRHSDGTELEFVRRKRKSRTLLDPKDDSPLPDDCLDRFLGSLGEDRFTMVFGIGHEALVKGGRQIAEGGGHFGEILFAASAGLADLRGVQAGLKSAMAELFLPQGQVRKINKTLADVRDAQADVRKLQLSGDEWRCHEQAFQEARKEGERLEEERHKKNRELNRLNRVRDALPFIAERTQVLVDLESCRDAVLLPDDFAEQRSNETTALVQARRDAEGAREEKEALERKLGLVKVPEALLEQAEAVETLHRRLGGYRDQKKDLPKCDLQKKYHEHEAKDILQSLGKARDLEQAEQLRLRRDQPLDILNLGNRRQALLVQQQNAQKGLEELERVLSGARQALKTSQTPADGVELRAAVRQTRELGAVERELQEEEAALQEAESQAGVDLPRLPHWAGSLAELERLPIPLDETLDRFERSFRESRDLLSRLNGGIEEKENAIRNLACELSRLELQQQVPTEDHLREARQRREDGWRLVRQAWREGRDDAGGVQTFVQESAPALELAEAYEASVRCADEVADRLRREADRVAGKAALMAQHNHYQVQLNDLVPKRKAVTANHDRLMRDWLKTVQSLALPEPAPSDVRAWVRQQNNLVLQAQALRKQRGHIGQLHKIIAANRVQIGGCLQRMGESVPREDETLAALLERSQSILDRIEKERQHIQNLTNEIADFEDKRGPAEALALTAEQELRQWQTAWSVAMAQLGLAETARPEAAQAFLAGISELFQELHDAAGFRSRITGMERDVVRFEEDVRELTERVAPELAALPTDRVPEELFLRLGQARAALRDRETLQQGLEKQIGKLRDANEAAARASGRLDALCLEAGCASVDDLPRAEDRSARRRQLEKGLGQCDIRLRSFSAGTLVEDFVGEAQQIDADLLPDSIEALKEETGKLQIAIGTVNQTIGAERKELERMDGSAAAAEAADKAETLLAQLHTDVPHYAALRLAAAVLQKGIECYREKNEGPVLAGASQRFKDLTCESFDRLRIDHADNGEAVLVGVRRGGKETVSVEGMSDGCRDQLYLALRLASLENWLESHEPIPFTVDDILLNFDDERATATLKALGQLSRRTQVIFFTHHDHMVDLAKRCLTEDALFIHRLRYRS